MIQRYLCVLLLFVFSRSYSQLSVTATAGTMGPTAYTTVKAAFDAINAGTHQGVISININCNTTETASAVLNASGSGAAVYTSVLLQTTGGTGSSITGNLAAPLIDLNGADNVTINGLNAGGNSLTISNTSTSNLTNTSTVRFINDASGNSIQNTTLLGAETSATLGTIFFSTGTTTGNDNNTISNCNIADASPGFPVNAVYSAGSVGQENSNNTLLSNKISNYFNADVATTGILIGTANSDWTISDNRLFQTAPRTFTTANIHRGIQVNSGNNHVLNANIIGYTTATATGTYTLLGAVASKFVAIELNVGTGTTSNINNNAIAGISFVTTSNANSSTIFGVWCGIYIIGGNVGVTNNIIGSTSAASSIVVSPTVNNAFVVAISSSSTGLVGINSNTIGGIDLTPSAAFAGTLAGIQTIGAGGTISIAENTIGNIMAANMRLGTVGVTTQGGTVRGILNTNTGTVNINYNTLRNLVNNGTASTSIFRGIETQGGMGTINKNIISNMSSGGSIANFTTHAGVGILISSTATGIIIDSNVIYNLSLTNAGTTGALLTGIYAGVPSASSGITNGLAISRNRIYNLSNANVTTSPTAPAIIVGIFCGNNNSANPLTIVNNMISLGNGQSTNTAIIGIHSHFGNAQNYTAKIYHNTINIAGSAASGAQPSFCYYRGDFSATASSVPTVDIQNNLFTNTRNGGTGKHYAIANGYPNAASSATNWSATASDYNVLNAAETTVGYWNGDQLINTWQTVSGGDAHSLSAVTVNYVNAPADLHLTFSGNAQISNKGIGLPAVLTDIDGDNRDATTPDPGADEFTSGTFPVSMLYFNAKQQGFINVLSWKMICNSPMVTFDIQRSSDARNFASIFSFTATRERCASPFDEADNNPLKGNNYYRLKITEPDGKVSYSAIVAILGKESTFELVGLMPSVIRNNAVLSVSSIRNTFLTVQVLSIDGKAVFSYSTKMNAGASTLPINLQSLNSGNYILNVRTTEGEIRTLKFIKL